MERKKKTKQPTQYMYYFTYYHPEEDEKRSYPEPAFESSELVVEDLGGRAPLKERGPEYQYYEDGITVKSIDFCGTIEAADRDAAWEEAVSRVWDTGNWADEDDDEQFFRVFYDYERRPKDQEIRSRESLRVELAHGLTHEWKGKPIEKYRGNRVFFRQWIRAEDIPNAWGKALKDIRKYKETAR